MGASPVISERRARQRGARLRAAAATALLAGWVCWCASANVSVPLNCAARQVVAPVTIDGKLDEWEEAQPVLLAGESHWRPAQPEAEYGGSSDVAARFYAAWDRNRLYLAIEAYDDDLAPPGDAEDMLQGDCIIVAVDARNNATQGYDEDDSEFGFAYTPAGPYSWRWFPLKRAGRPSPVKVAVVREVKPGAVKAGIPPIKLTYEIAIPWSELHGATPGEGEALGFDIVVNDADGNRRYGWLEWTSGILGIKDPSRFGNIVLTVTAPPAPEQPAPAP
jgi:hypothetical protein